MKKVASKLQEHEIKQTRCPICGKKLECATNFFGENAPKPGDATICIRCGHAAIFDDELGLRPATPEEQEQISQSEEVAAIRRAQTSFFDKIWEASRHGKTRN